MRSTLGRPLRVVAATLAAVTVAGCSSDAATDAPPTPAAVHSRVEVVAEHPHDRQAFTQGLEIHDGALYEGTGLVGQSWVRATDLDSGEVRAHAYLEPPLFGEGITVTDDALWQLTWRNGLAIERDPATLDERRRVPIETEGWGVCALERSGLGDEAGASEFVTSDGTATLTFRDGESFAPTRTVDVRDADGTEVTMLNELECTPDGVYANVWQSDTIVRIDPGDGTVTETIDASSLRAALGPQPQDAPPADVLNGIAAIEGTDRFLVTGKNWPTLFEVRFVS
ncbi:glutaminyl-peptide cyclotransferase [Rhodococcus rhodnii]|nr:glutaminyl-peptide cyclotransferase [Rhodococcus rhodnii]TXG92253.1 glutaminyl-peptide cyclotransferase [Rhodococcus rhodnii]